MVQFLEIPEARNGGTVSFLPPAEHWNGQKICEWRCWWGIQGEPQGRAPALGPNSFIFMQFFFCKNLPVCAPNGRTSKTHQHLPQHRTVIAIQGYFPKVNAQHSENETSFSSQQIPLVRSSLAALAHYPR